MDKFKKDLEEKYNQATVFNNVNSVYDFVLKNSVDTLICKINSMDDEVIRLIKYLKTDENFNVIKLVILSDIAEYEIIRSEKDFSYSYFQKISEYNKEEFFNEINKL